MTAVVRVLAVADEVDEVLRSDARAAQGTELIVSCGDLPFNYLAELMTALDAPLVFVPGNHDGDDLPHSGFAALAALVARLRPPLLVHGHVHPYGRPTPDLRLGATVVRNVVGRHVFDVELSGAT